MLQELKFQLSTAILTILTLAASVGAVTNLWQYEHFRLADDGVIWVDRAGRVEALNVAPDSPGAKAPIHPGDHLERIEGFPVRRALDVPQLLARIGSWRKATYTIDHGGVTVEPTVTDVLAAIDLHRLHRISYWDSLILRCAIQSGCRVLLSEDMQHGQEIDGVRVVNPFL